MGFWGVLFGSDPETKIRKARKYLERHDFSEARLELLDVVHPDAEGLMTQALDGLIRLNLEEAAARSRSGDPAGAAEHMELAQSFGAKPEQVRAIRRSMREARQAERQAQEAAKQAPISPEGSDPLWALDPDNPRLRFALLLEAWPSDLQSRLVDLGPQFAEAALLLEEGHAQEAVQKLTPFAESDPAARIFRARALLAMGNLPAAASDLHTFSQALGHRVIGKQSTAVLLTQTLGQLGRLEEALAVVETESEKLPENDPLQLPLSGSRAALLEGLGRLEEAETTCEAVVLQAPRDLGLYRMLARIREARGNRMGAMQALEGGLNTCCSSPERKSTLRCTRWPHLGAVVLGRSNGTQTLRRVATRTGTKCAEQHVGRPIYRHFVCTKLRGPRRRANGLGPGHGAS